MSKLERTIIALASGLICPALTFALFWWTAAAIHLYLVPLPLGVIIAAAFSGLGLGFLLDAFYLRKWVEKFYAPSLRRMLAVYLALFAFAFAIFMGFPNGTFAMGIIACAYVGRREHHRQTGEKQFRNTLRQTALLTSALTALVALPIGILGLNEPIAGTMIATVGLDRHWLRGTSGWLLVELFCLLLFAVQFVCARLAGILMFQLGPKKRQHFL